MGLASALSTALSGLTAAETQLDVAGNNLANSQTVGFKASDVVFATQFFRTQSRGSAPTDTGGGTNPRQNGLGVQVAEITPNFTQGTIQASGNSSDLAIQGDGFFIVDGAQGERLYTRNGIFKTNSASQIVTPTGNRLLGFGVDESFNVQATQLVPIEIPLGSATVAQATQTVMLNGNLTPQGDIADAAEVIESSVLGDAAVPRPATDDPADPTLIKEAATPDASSTTGVSGAGVSTFVAGEQYEYVVAFVDSTGNESTISSDSVSVTVNSNGDNITLTSLPSSPNNALGAPEYDQLNLYRRQLGVPASDPNADYRRIGSAAQGAASFTDSGLPTTTALDDSRLEGTYSYMVTFGGPGVTESRPSPLLGPVNVVDGRVHLDNLPEFPTGTGIPAYSTVNIYRNLADSPQQFFHVAEVAQTDDYTDARSDAEISDLLDPANREINQDGPPITSSTLMTNVLQRNEMAYEQAFETGTLTFAGKKGDRDLASKSFEITDTTTVGEWAQFLTTTLGIQSSNIGNPNPIPGSNNSIPGESGTLPPGAVVTNDGRIRIVANNGVHNRIAIEDSAGFRLETSDGSTSDPALDFTSVQQAVGESVLSDFVAYDSLGVALEVRLTAVLEARDGDLSTYRWFADSSDNDPLGTDDEIAVGTGLVTFDGDGKFVSSTNSTINIEREDIPSTDPLSFELDFSSVSGFAQNDNDLTATQDGSPAGKLTNYSVGSDGLVTGVFSNGASRTLGQVRLARFSNPAGLDQRGHNLYAQGVNSGVPVEGAPGDLGIGTVVAGALELSNTDIGENLIDLVLASTHYRSNSRVISTAQQLLDELLNLRR